MEDIKLGRRKGSVGEMSDESGQVAWGEVLFKNLKYL